MHGKNEQHESTAEVGLASGYPNYTKIIEKFSEPGPYYTSYPTLGLWSKDCKSTEYSSALIDFFAGEGQGQPVHLYLHIPFCAKLCWYCMCNIKVTNKRPEIQIFVDHLLSEIEMLRNFFDKNKLELNIKEIHLGGGTPSHLDNTQFASIMQALGHLTDLKKLDEFAMEIDPRTTNPDNLRYYASHGVSRISFGVQDFDENVQKAINRIQPPELIDALFASGVRECFKGINFDLLYGLPRQTRETFRKTVDLVKKFAPDRITLLKYAHVPELRKHMKLIEDNELPKDDSLPLMFMDTVQSLVEGEYEWVGIDNFAKRTDALGQASQQKKVWRTFNGFTPGRTRHLFGLGPTTTAAFGPYYFQNVYDIKQYYEKVEQAEWPVFRAYKLANDQRIRRDAIFSLICNLKLDLVELGEKYGIDAKDYFKTEMQMLEGEYSNIEAVEVDIDEGLVRVTTAGRYIVRGIAKVFDLFNRGQDYRIQGC